MREIMFKAKRIDNGEWVEGFLFYMMYDGVKVCCIGCEPIHGSDYGDIIGLWYMVDEETVCQYTGLTDKSGVKIFNGDVVIVYRGWHGEKKCTVQERGGAIVVENDAVWYGLFGLESQMCVIGNIHDEVTP